MPVTYCELFPEIHPEHARVSGPELHLKYPLNDTEAERLYTATRAVLETRLHQNIINKPEDFTTWDAAANKPKEQAIAALAVIGRLLVEGWREPLGGGADTLQIRAGARTVKVSPRFITAVVDAFNAYSAQLELTADVLTVLRRLGTDDKAEAAGAATVARVIYGRQLVEVTDHLSRSGVRAGDPYIDVHVERALNAVLGGFDETRASSVTPEMLDLESGSAATVRAENVRALSFLYQAAILEELKVPQVVDRIIQHWTEGTLPITLGPGPDLIYRYFRTTQDRITEVERRSIFARCFGLAQGSVEVDMPNREFTDLWIRFLSGVSAYNREASDKYSERKTVVAEQVFKSGRDLGSNLSLHGFGMPHFAAVELRKTYDTMLAILGSSDILQAYGVVDRWQLVERVSTLYLGGAVNGVKLRTMAQSGATIIAWIADFAQTLSAASVDSASFDTAVRKTIITGTTAGRLADEVERWLAVTGTGTQTVQQYSEPVSINVQNTIPALSLAGGTNVQTMLQNARALLPNGTVPQA